MFQFIVKFKTKPSVSQTFKVKKDGDRWVKTFSKDKDFSQRIITDLRSDEERRELERLHCI